VTFSFLFASDQKESNPRPRGLIVGRIAMLTGLSPAPAIEGVVPAWP